MLLVIGKKHIKKNKGKMKMRKVLFWICLPIFIILGTVMCVFGWDITESY